MYSKQLNKIKVAKIFPTHRVDCLNVIDFKENIQYHEGNDNFEHASQLYPTRKLTTKKLYQV